MCSISIRESIRWIPEPASEPTSTIVLTSPGRRFVDLRILPAAEDDETNTEREVGLPLSRLDWAIAGYSRSESRNGVTHSTWEHFVDSRSTRPEELTDEGDMFPQGHGRTLEKGRMVNPATGRETDYEEVWLDVDPSPVPEIYEGNLVFSLREPKPRCVVLQLQCDERGERGMVVRLGEYCQGFVRRGDEIALERWKATGGWTLSHKMGSLWLPCKEAIGDYSLSTGDKVEHEGQTWNVVERCDI
ncbi:hypothetical protein F4778DRAFT_738967 [Xylariomycetidae sp. FL2044]|nr:hypothetical protein F4778DRAFT_738967 [Xylariomycetidae sp. FL2044]